ncbi:venom allergen 5-like [Haematobia irritans]|uniref:venom allergen 5-like n=1 Tax=Haematobia irritans TaxID=7368 RepID=UPI003F50A305
MFKIYFVSLFFIFRILFVTYGIDHNYLQYQFQLPLDGEHLCPSSGYQCANGKLHFLCQPPKICPDYKYIPLTNEWRRIFIDGHNGIRHKVAEDWGIANMNLVHWSRDLETMAIFYLQTCEIFNDQCLVIGEQKLQVKQNYCLRRRLSKRWPGRVVRSWYLEIGYNINSMQEYMAQHQQIAIANFSQMIWPSLEFVGCGVASIRRTLYLIVCYYYPAYVEPNITQEYQLGIPCTKCKKNRNVCSLDFLGLCGIDVDMSKGTKIVEIPFLLILIYQNLWHITFTKYI